MKVKPGMFVRTKYRNEVVIRQIKNIFETSEHDHQLVFDKPTRYQYYVEDNNFIAKERLIELVEVGDYVNGYRVTKVNVSEIEGHYSYVKCINNNTFKEDNILDIVTKEEFEREKYVIGDD